MITKPQSVCMHNTTKPKRNRKSRRKKPMARRTVHPSIGLVGRHTPAATVTPAVPAAKRALPFAALAQAFLAQKQYQVKESTYVHYRRIIQTHLLPAFGALSIHQIDGFAVERFIGAQLESGCLRARQGLSPKSVKDTVTLLKAIFRYAARQGHGIDRSVLSVQAPSAGSRPTEIFTDSQRILLEEQTREAASLYFGIYLALYTGLRLGELCALRWEDISTERGTLEVRHTLSRIADAGEGGAKTKLVIGPPKTAASRRVIPLSMTLNALLSARRPPEGGLYLLTGSPQFIEPRNYYQKYRAFLEAQGIPPHTFHALRHTFATRCVEKGFDPKVLSEILGHTNVKITLDRYVHPSLERKRQCMQLLG